jgi:NAD(P)H-dependent flavin oxidoreductase YrpB (nitropropane dioxygenase family)
MLKNDWTEAWDGPESPGTLGMPLQFMVTSEAVSRGHRYADKAKDVMFNPAGQVIGHINAVRPVREVMNELVNGYLEAVERLQALTPG